jgi:WD40 repeat protein
LTDKTLVTGFGSIVGTLEYMSPEQAEINQLDIDTRSDIYSLGVLLYRLLTGTTPLERSRLKDTGLLELLRSIRDDETPRPSRRLSTIKDLPQIASKRGVEPKKLSGLMRGELDWIVMKALEKDRNRRYETASAFAADVQRYLRDEPVEACPPSALYRFRKFARRHKGVLRTASVLAGAVLLAVVALAVSTLLTWRANQDLHQALNRERDTLERERQNAYYQRIALAEREWSANNLGRMLQLLDECPEDLRGWEWHYLKRLPRGGLAPLRHSGAALSAAISPDGQCIASASQDGFVTLWDAQTGRKLFPSFKAHEGPSQSVAISPDCRLLAWGGQDRTVVPFRGIVMVWDVETGQLLRQLEGHGSAVSKVAFSPDGQRLAAAGWVRSDEMPQRGDLKIWDVTTGNRLLTVHGNEGAFTCVAFSPDGKRLATGSAFSPGSSVKIWDAQTGEEQQTFRGHKNVHCVAFSPDGRLVASGGDYAVHPAEQEVKVWDAETGQEVFSLRGHQGSVWGVAFSPDGRRLASASLDRTVKLWDVVTRKETLTLRGHLDSVGTVAFSRDGRRLVSASPDGTVRVWDAAPLTDEDPNCVTLAGPGGAVASVAFHPKDERIMAAAYGDGKVRVWDLSSGKPRCFHTLAVGKEGGVSALAFSREGQWLAAVTGKELKVWNATTYQEARAIPGDPNFYCVTFSPDEKQVAAAGFSNFRIGFAVRVWGVANDDQPRVFPGNTWAIWQVAFSPDGQHLASAGNDGTVRLWDVKAGKAIDIPRLTPACPSHGLAFSPDGKRLALGCNDQVVRVWDTTAWKLLHEYRDLGGVQSVAFSPDGQRLAWGSTDSTVKVWDLPASRAGGGDPQIHTLRGHTSWVQSVAFSADGKQIASASADGTVKIWKAPPVAELPGSAAKDRDP